MKTIFLYDIKSCWTVRSKSCIVILWLLRTDTSKNILTSVIINLHGKPYVSTKPHAR